MLKLTKYRFKKPKFDFYVSNDEYFMIVHCYLENAYHLNEFLKKHNYFNDCGFDLLKNNNQVEKLGSIITDEEHYYLCRPITSEFYEIKVTIDNLPQAYHDRMDKRLETAEKIDKIGQTYEYGRLLSNPTQREYLMPLVALGDKLRIDELRHIKVEKKLDDVLYDNWVNMIFEDETVGSTIDLIDALERIRKP